MNTFHTAINLSQLTSQTCFSCVTLKMRLDETMISQTKHNRAPKNVSFVMGNENFNKKSRSLSGESYSTMKEARNRTSSRTIKTSTSFTSPRAHKVDTIAPKSKSFVFKKVDFDPKVPTKSEDHVDKANFFEDTDSINKGRKFSLTLRDIFDGYEADEDEKEVKDSRLMPNHETQKPLSRHAHTTVKQRTVNQRRTRSTNNNNRLSHKQMHRDVLPDHLKSLLTAFSRLYV